MRAPFLRCKRKRTLLPMKAHPNLQEHHAIAGNPESEEPRAYPIAKINSDDFNLPLKGAKALACFLPNMPSLTTKRHQLTLPEESYASLLFIPACEKVMPWYPFALLIFALDPLFKQRLPLHQILHSYSLFAHHDAQRQANR